jgi:tetratricopeptide (TPR) repeat protein/polyferredoxin
MDARPNIERKKKYTRWRTYSLLGVYLLMGIHIAHWKIAGTTLAPLEFNEVLYTIHLGIITAGFIFMGMTVIGTLFFGRFFCSWACHILALQDFSAWILEKMNIHPKPLKSRAFFLVPLAAVIYLFVWPQIQRLLSGEPFPQWRVFTDKQGWASFITTDYWRNLPSVPVMLLTFFVSGFSFIYFLGSRSFCQNVCPYGVLFALADRITPGKIKLTGDCNSCGICTEHCSSHIVVHKEIMEFGKVVNPNCLKDLDCVAVCPNDAIQFGFTKPSLFQSLSGTGKYKKHFNFSLAEDILLAILTFAFVIVLRGLYDLIPFLLALSLAVIFSYFSILFIRIFHREYVRIGPFILKHSGKLTTAGKYFSVLVSFLFVFTVHSSYVHYHSYTGELQYREIVKKSNDFQLDPNSDAVKSTVESSLEHLSKASALGIYSPASLNRELAAIYLYKQDYQKAEKHLLKMLLSEPGDLEARLLLAKSMYVLHQTSEAEEELKKIVSNADISTEHDYKIRSDAFLMLGHLEEKSGFPSAALAHYEQSLKDNPEHVEAMLALGIISMQSGNLVQAEKYLRACNEKIPDSPLIHNNLSVIYMKLKNRDLAIYHLNELIRLQPANANAQYNLGMLLYSDGKKSESLTALQKAVSINPDYMNAHLALAHVLNEMGENTEANIHEQKASEIKSFLLAKNSN